ncbi:MAG: hypothetical protein AVDCRST_MAG76-1485, partial [uncultured Acidimicrobiales bacterium]
CNGSIGRCSSSSWRDRRAWLRSPAPWRSVSTATTSAGQSHVATCSGSGRASSPFRGWRSRPPGCSWRRCLPPERAPSSLTSQRRDGTASRGSNLVRSSSASAGGERRGWTGSRRTALLTSSRSTPPSSIARPAR